MSSTEVVERLAALDAERAALIAASVDALSHTEVLEVLEAMETSTRRAPADAHPLIARLHEVPPRELGGKTVAAVLARRLRISKPEAKRRLADAQMLGPRHGLTGEPLPPLWTATAAAQAAGTVSTEHITIIRRFFTHLPAAVDAAARELAETSLAAVAAAGTPEDLAQAADVLTGYLNPDGAFSDADRARKRGVTLGKQDPDGMTPISGWLNPELRALLDAILAKLAAPGMCNPDDETPCVDDEPTPEAAGRDTRTQRQRHHDALIALCRAVLTSGRLGSHRGLPVTVILRTTLQELEDGHGHVVAGGGSWVPMSDLLRMATHSYHYLAVFDKHTNLPLYLGRTRRLASPGQRIMLYAQQRGCTCPGCTVPAIWTEVHHDTDWGLDGHTNVNELTLTCPASHKLLSHGWKIRKRPDNRVEWIPPPHIDGGTPQINNYFFPENYLINRVEDEDEDEERDTG